GAHQRREAARILPELLTEGDAVLAPITEGWQQIGFYNTLIQALLGNDPSLILLLDDIQWCDRDTLEWLKYLIRNRPTAKILILATLLEGETPTLSPMINFFDHLRQLGRLTEGELPRLNAEQTAALAASIRGRDIPDSFFFRESEGVPLFIVEMARSGLEENRMGRIGLKEFSPRLQATLVGRLSRLGDTARSLAHAAAVLGREFNLPLISTVAGLGETDAMLALDELWQRRIVREKGSGKYYFSHDRLGEAALSDLSPVRLRWLHLQAARALEQFGGEDGVIAGHYVEAGESVLAAHAFSRAAQRAASLFALEEARALVERAISLDGRSGSERYELYGDILSHLGLLRQASEAYGRALVVCQAADWQAQARLHRRILNCVSRVNYHSARNAYQQGSADLLKAVQKDAGFWEEWLELHLNWMRANYWVSNAPEVERVIQLLDEPLKMWGTPLQKIQHRHGILLHHLLTHQFTATAEQVKIARQNVTAADELNSPVHLAEQLSSLGLVAFMAGEFGESIQAYNACLVVAEAYSLQNILERAYAYLSLAYRRKKMPEMANEALNRLTGVIKQTQMRTYRSLEIAQRAWLAWCEGDNRSAQRLAIQAIEGWSEEKILYPLQWAGRMVLLALAVREQDLPQAVVHAQTMLQSGQQQLSPAMDAALQTALDAGVQGTLENWQQVVAAILAEGYL
ncbi:MAG: hypothetical protein JXB15_16600, partial [Anaerolineales bacterium]|nr:hypothetical protein [Anaerolineales bacterium]